MIPTGLLNLPKSTGATGRSEQKPVAGSELSLDHNYSAPGTFTVSVTVSDAAGNLAPAVTRTAYISKLIAAIHPRTGTAPATVTVDFTGSTFALPPTNYQIFTDDGFVQSNVPTFEISILYSGYCGNSVQVLGVDPDTGYPATLAGGSTEGCSFVPEGLARGIVASFQNDIWLLDDGFDDLGGAPMDAQLTVGPDSDGFPRWDETGTRVVFSRSDDIWMVTTGAVLQQLTSGPGRDDTVADLHGNSLVFSRFTQRIPVDHPRSCDWFGIGAFRSARPSVAREPRWSPDGSQVAFVMGGQIWRIGADGIGAHQVTHLANAPYGPSWSPDESKLVYVSRNLDRVPQLWLVNADGTDEHLVGDGVTGGFPSFSPDGARIAYAAPAAGDNWVYTVGIDGTYPTFVDTGYTPDWFSVGGGADVDGSGTPPSDGIAPIAQDDEVTVIAGDTLTLEAPGVLANDSGRPALRATALGSETLSSAFWSLSTSGEFTIDATSLEPSTHEIGYRLTEADGDTAEATIRVTILERTVVSDGVPPEAVDDDVEVVEGQTLTLPAPGVLGNDSGRPALRATALGSDTLSSAFWTLSSSGALTIDATSLHPSHHEIRYRLTEADGDTAEAVIRVEIVEDAPVSDGVAPTAVDDVVAVYEGESVTLDAPGVLENDSGRAPLHATALGSDTLSNAFWSLSSSGAFTINATTLHPSRHVVRYRLTEADGDTADAVIEVVILTRNPVAAVAPLIAIDDSIGVYPGQKLVLAAPGILNNDLGQPPFTAVRVTAGSLSLARVQVRADGQVKINAVGLAEGIYTFGYSIRNSAGLYSNPAAVTVTVDNHNTCPVPVGDLYRVRAGALFDTGVPGVLVNDLDREGQVKSLVVIGGNASGAVAFSVRGFTVYKNGRVTFDATAVRDPGPGNQFIRQVTYLPSDDVGESCASNTAPIRIEIFGNKAPIAQPNFYIPGNSYYVHAGGVLVFPARGVLGNDSDPDDPRTSLTATLVGKDFAGGSLSLNPDGSFRLQAPPASVVRPGATLKFRYQAVDPHGARSNVATVTITVVAGPSPVVRPPVATSPPPPPPPAGAEIPAGTAANHKVHAEETFYLNEDDGLLSTATDADHQQLRIDVVSVSDDRIEVDSTGEVFFDTELEDAGKTFTARYRVVDYDGLQSPIYTLKISVLAPRERCSTVTMVTDASLDTPAGSTGSLLNSTGSYRYCWNKIVVTRGGFVDESDNWLDGSPGIDVIDGHGDSVDAGYGTTPLAEIAGFFADNIPFLRFSGRADPGNPIVHSHTAYNQYISNASWGYCFDPQSIFDLIPYGKAFKVLEKADPIFKDMFDDVAGKAVDEALGHLRSNSNWAYKLHQSMIELIDPDSSVADFLDKVAGETVTITYTDGTVAHAELWELALLFASGLAIVMVDCVDLPTSWGFERATASVTVNGTYTGAVDVVSDGYEDGPLSYLEVHHFGIDISKVKWDTDVSVGEPEIVGIDLYTGSPLP